MARDDLERENWRRVRRELLWLQRMHSELEHQFGPRVIEMSMVHGEYAMLKDYAIRTKRWPPPDRVAK